MTTSGRPVDEESRTARRGFPAAIFEEVMASPGSAPSDIDVRVGRVRLRTRSWGPPDGPLVLCVHGVSANLTAFSSLAEVLAARGRRVVAVDLRGRGRSDIGPDGTAGIDRHAEDVLGLADEIGVDRFAVVGWSMGALVALRMATFEPERMVAAALIDVVGPTDERVPSLVEASVARLDMRVPSPDTYIEAIRSKGLITPWTPFWDEHYAYELAPDDEGGWSPSTDRAACVADMDDIGATDWTGSWGALRMPTLLVRARRPFAGCTFVPDAALEAFTRAVPGCAVVPVDSDHFTLLTDPAVHAALDAFLPCGVEGEPPST